jgi:RNA polymerase sigma factor (sigma-70 family)
VKKKDVTPEDEFAALIRRFSSFIYAQIQKVYPQQMGLDRDDLYQEVGMVLWKVFKGEKKIKHQSSYIMRVVNSVVIDHIRSARRQQRGLEVEKANVDLLGRIEKTEDQTLLMEGISQLSEPRQRAVRLFLLELDIAEIASMCGWTDAKTRNLVYRGLSDIKDILGKKGRRK